jgi:hypothetical protein
MRLLIQTLLSLGAISILAGCASRPVGELSQYQGRYSFAFEKSQFTPCTLLGSDGSWWVIPSGDAQRQRDSLVAALPANRRTELFVRWRGTITTEGPAGHLGKSSRYIMVAEILELRPASAGDCLRAS